MKIIKKICDKKHFTDTYYFLGIKIFNRKRFHDLYCMYRRYQDRANTSASYLSYCDIRKCRPASGELRKKQLKVCELLRTVCSIAEKNNLIYWLDFGTLLGSYRHQGFVPWDDDGDISMPREDYNKILPLLKKHFEKEPDYVVREGLYEKHHGRDFWHFQVRIYSEKEKFGIDIFPVDEIESDISKSQISRLLMDGQELIKTKLLPKATKTEYLHEAEIVLNNIKRNLGKPQRKVCFCGLDYPMKRKSICHEFSDIYPLKKGKFEGYYFFIPNNCEQYLEDLYGEYNCFPSLDFDYFNGLDMEFPES